MTNEADTCRKFVVPKLQSAGWDNEPHSIAEQRTITDGASFPWARPSSASCRSASITCCATRGTSRLPWSRRRSVTNPRPMSSSRPATMRKSSVSNTPTPPTAPRSSRSTISRARKRASPTSLCLTAFGDAIRRVAESTRPSGWSTCYVVSAGRVQGSLARSGDP